MRRLALLLLLLLSACGGGEGNFSASDEAAPAANTPPSNTGINDKPANRNVVEATRLYNEAGDLALKGDNTAAAELLERAAKLDPGSSLIHARLGHVYISLLRHEDAHGCFVKAADLEQGVTRAELQTRAAWCSHKLATAAFTKESYDTALAHVDRAIEVNSGDAELHMLRGHIQFKRADYAAAAEAFGVAADLALPDKRPEALSWKGQSEFHAGWYRPAIETFSRLIDDGIDGYEAYGWRAYCHVQIGKKPEAESDFNQAAKRTTDPAKRADYEAALRALAEAE